VKFAGLLSPLAFRVYAVACFALVSAGVSAQTCGPSRIEVEADVCTPFGEEFTAEIVLRDPNLPIVGAAFIVEYSATTFKYRGFDFGDPPMDGIHFLTLSPGRIQASVNIRLGSDPATTDTVMLRLRFEVINEGGSPYIRFSFDPTGNFRNLLVISGGEAQIPILIGKESHGVDLHDYADFQMCFRGPDRAAHLDCRCAFDHDLDGDVDFEDWEAMQGELDSPLPVECGP